MELNPCMINEGGTMGSWGSLARAFARDGARIERQKQAAANRAKREAERQRLAQQRERLKRDKEAYIQARTQRANTMGSELIESFDSLNQILQNIISAGRIHVFDEIRNHYVEEPFVYTEPMPRYIAPVLQPVPQKSWLEKVFKSKEQARENIIAANEAMENEAKAEYIKLAKEYAEEKALAEKKWVEEQAQKKFIFNQQVDSEEKAYLSGDEDALKGYLDALIELSGFMQDVTEVYECGYQPITKRLVLDIHMKKRDEIFYAERYRYVIKTDEIVPVKMKVSSANERLKLLMVELAISAVVIALENDEANAINDIVVNLFHEGICCVSAYVDANTYAKYNFENRSSKSMFIQRQMKIFKSLTNGVPAFDYIYGTDLR